MIVFLNNYALSDLVAVEVIGTVNSINLYQNCVSDDSIFNNASMTGTCVYDTDWIDLDPLDFNGRYWLSDITIDIGGYHFYYNWGPLPQGFIDVYSGDLGYWAYTEAASFDGIVNIDGSKTYSEVDWDTTEMTLFDLCSSTNDFGTDDSLPIWFPDVSYFNLRNNFSVSFLDVGGNGFEISGEITSINVVPEPSMLLLLGIGGLSFRRRRHRNSHLEGYKRIQIKDF